MKGKKYGKTKKTALTKAVKTVVKKELRAKRNDKIYSMIQTTGDINYPTDPIRYNEEIGRIVKYDPTATTGRAGNLSQARVSNKIHMVKLKCHFGFINKGSYNNCIRIYCFRNTNLNEPYNVTGSNLNQNVIGESVSYSTDLILGAMQSFNWSLVRNKSDLLFDKVYEIPYDHAPTTYTIMNRRVFTITKRINKDFFYESKPDTASGQENKGPKYYLVWHILTAGTANGCLIEGDVMLDQCYTEDA